MAYRDKRRPSFSKSNDGQRTAQETRQTLATGSVADVTSYIPRLPEPPAPALPTPRKVITRLSDEDVETAIEFIKRSQIGDYLAQRHNAGKKKEGRPALVPVVALLVAMQLAVRDNRPLLLTEIRDILCFRISPAMRNLLDVKIPQKATSDVRKWEVTTARAVGRAFHRLLASIDPSIHPKNRIRTWDEVDRLKKDLTVEEQTERATALDWVCNQLLEAAYQQLPPEVRQRQAKNAGYCIDGTPLPLFARGRGVHNPEASADPDGGFYVRHGDHKDPEDVKKGTPSAESKGKFVRSLDKRVWAREIHLLALADTSHPDRQYIPALPIAFTSDRPGLNPAGAARRIFANMAFRNHQPGWLAGDILYTNQQDLKFQIPAREAGYKLVLGYGVNQLGRQGAHESGMVLVEGAYYGPCVPDDLANAAELLRQRKITLQQFGAMMKARAEFRMRTKQPAKPGTNGKPGTNERLQCPAAGDNPLVICAHKPKSQKDRPTTQSDGAKIDVRREINHKKVVTKGAIPHVCNAETVTVAIEDGAKFRQTLPFGSPEHTDRYNRLRQSQEGIHGTAKDEGRVALANPGRRRVRGWAAQQLFTAFLLAETASQRITAFMDAAKPDKNGDLFVLRRRPVKGRDNLPPGGAFEGVEESRALDPPPATD